MKKTVDVIVPVYQPGKKFSRLLQMLSKQSWPIRRIIIMNTERSYWNEEGYRGIAGLEVHHLTKEEFDHGATRDLAAWYAEADIMVFMTDDAVPQDNYLIERLVEAMFWTGKDGETVAMAYARQLPDKSCRLIERYTRSFNYPAKSSVKTAADIERLGIKTYFASNACCAYDRRIYTKLDGFVNRAIFNEDMIYAAEAIKHGYAIAYAADAQVVHSHNYTGPQQFRRNFDLAVSQADHPEVFAGLPSEGEGIRLVKKTASYLTKTGRIWLLPELVYKSGCKYAGYWLGSRYKMLPEKVILKSTMNQEYWKKAKRRGKNK